MQKKKIKLFLVLIITIVLSGCQKFFRDDLENRLEIENIEDLENAVGGLYNRFYASIIDNLNLYGINSDERAFVSEFRRGGGICMQIYSASDISDQTDHLWKSTYSTIINANSILKKAEALDKNNTQINGILGEVYFIRAYSYFNLVRFFGKVPIVTDDEVSYTISKSEFEDIYGFIADELKKASSALPESHYKARIPFVTPGRGTAKALLAEVYLSMAGYPLKKPGFYELAAKTAKELIDSARFYGFSLLPDYKDLWNEKHKINAESVFSLYLKENDFNNEWEYPNAFSIGRQSPYVGIKFFNQFSKNYRKSLTYRVDNINGNRESDSIPDTMDLCSDVKFRKIYNPFSYPLLNRNEGRTIYLIRFSKTLLTYAEAKARMSDLDKSAYDALNLVRRRANHTELFSSSPFDLQTGLSPSQFADSVLQERAQEFCAEPDGRQMDLLRLEMLDLLPELRLKQQGALKPVGIDPVTKFFPIPKLDKKFNPNLE